MEECTTLGGWDVGLILSGCASWSSILKPIWIIQPFDVKASGDSSIYGMHFSRTWCGTPPPPRFSGL